MKEQTEKQPDTKKPQLGLLIVAEVLCIAAVLALVVIVAQKHLPGLMNVLKSGNEKDIEAFLRNTHADTSILFLGLMQFIQVISVVIPSFPIHIAAGVTLGLRNGFLVCYIGFILANYLIFKVVRLIGAPVKKYLQASMKKGGKFAKVYDKLTSATNPTLIITIAYLLPFLPNGAIPYAAAQTEVTDLQFLLALAGGSLFPVLADCAVGSFILTKNYLMAALVFIALYSIAGILLLNEKKIVARFSHHKDATE